MPEYLSPGVYIEERLGLQTIAGVSTSTTGMVGVTQKGPTEGKPVFVDSLARFREVFGGFLPAPELDQQVRWLLDDREGGAWWLLPLAVKGFFDNGGRRLYIKRVVSAQATAAEVEIGSGVVADPPAGRPDALDLAAGANLPALLRAAAKAKGDWGNDLSVRVMPERARRIPAVSATGTGPIATTLAEDIDGTANAVIRWPDRLDGVQGPVQVVISGQPYQVATLPTPANGQATLVLAPAPEGRIRRGTPVKILRQVDTGAANQPRRVPLSRTSPEAVYVGALVLVGPAQARATVTAVEEPNPLTGAPGAVLLDGANLPPVFETQQLTVVEAALGVQYRQSADPAAPTSEAQEVVEEIFHALHLHPLSGTPTSIVDVVNAESRLISLDVVPLQPPVVTWDLFPGSTEPGDRYLQLAGGDDRSATLTPDDFAGQDGGSGRRTGVQAMEDLPDVSIVAVPGIWSRTVQNALVGHCELLRDRFAILDPQMRLGIQDVQAFRQRLDSQYAALYHPWLRVRDPLSGQDVDAPPSGHMAGVYARVDVLRGVHKAPANEVIGQINGFVDDVNQRQQDLLNPNAIN